MIKLDQTDKELLRLIQENGKLTIKELSAQLNLSPTPIFNRLKKLEREGVIEKYVGLIAPEKVNKDIISFCYVSVTDHSKKALQDFEKAVLKLEEVQECYYIAGKYDFLLKIISNDIKTYNNFMIEQLSSMKNVSTIESNFVMRSVKKETSVNLDNI